MTDKSSAKLAGRYRKQTYLAIILLVVCMGLIVLTIELSRLEHYAFLVNQKERIISIEIALFGILVVELLSRAWVGRYRESDALHAGMTVRAIFRTVAYSILAIAVVSILSANPALAVGVGTVTGVVVGFSAQSLIGNVIAGTILAITRPMRVGDNITVMGNTGRVIDIGIIFTTVDASEEHIFIPNMTMLSNAIRVARKKTE
jgi:small conductance mechanosensitive channel